MYIVYHAMSNVFAMSNVKWVGTRLTLNPKIFTWLNILYVRALVVVHERSRNEKQKCRARAFSFTKSLASEQSRDSTFAAFVP